MAKQKWLGKRVLNWFNNSLRIMKAVKTLLLVVATLMAANLSFAQTWTPSGAPNLNWQCVASSADGSRLFAVASPWVYCISTNSGSTWITNTEPQYPTYGSWSSIASSADGTTLVGINYTLIWVSTNSGTTWFSNNVPGASFFASVALSADGKKITVADGKQSSPGLIYTSTNSGVTVTPTTAPAYNWTSVASSVDGTKLVAAALNSSQGGVVIYTSTNSGATWVLKSIPGYYWQSVASSADGTKLVVVEYAGPIYTSTNSGATWTSNNVLLAGWLSVASSADGSKLVAATPQAGFAGTDNRIYTSYSTPAPSLSVAPSGSNLTLAWTLPSTNFVLQPTADPIG